MLWDSVIIIKRIKRQFVDIDNVFSAHGVILLFALTFATPIGLSLKISVIFYEGYKKDSVEMTAVLGYYSQSTGLSVLDVIDT